MDKTIKESEEYKIFTNIYITKIEIKALIISLLIILIAKGTVLFNLSYSIDDYMFSFMNNVNDMKGFFSFVLTQGRFGSILPYKMLMIFGIHPLDSYLLCGVLAIVSTIIVGLLICRIWGVNSLWQQIAVIVVFGVHPYSAELYTFKIALFIYFICFTIGYIGLYLIDNKLINFIIGTLLLSFSLSMYQLVVNYYSIIIIFSIILFFLNNSEIDVSTITKIFIKSSEFYRIISLVLGIIIYFFSNKLIMYLSRIPTEIRGGSILDLSDISNRIYQIIDELISIFITHETIFPKTTKVLILFLIAFAVIGILLHLFNKFNKTKLVYSLLLSVLMIFAAISIIGVIIPLKNMWIVPRVLSAAGIFLGGIIVILYRCYNNKTLKNIFAIAITIIIISFIGVNNNIYADQLRINKMDAFRANRLFVRLEMLPEFDKVKKIGIVVGPESSNKILLRTNIGHMNKSALTIAWAKQEVIKEVTGFNFLKLENKDYEKIKNYCEKNNKQDNTDFVTIIDDIGLLWLK